MSKNRLIWFCHDTFDTIDPSQVLARLRDEIGLTTIMPENPICHTSGFSISNELAQRGPFEDWRTRQNLWPKAAEGIYPPVAGIVSGFDDTPLLRLIESAHNTGIEVWGHLGLWSYGGDVYPEYAMQDIEEHPLDTNYKQWGIGLCPSRTAINEWTRDCLIEAAHRYDLDGFCLDHARYPAPANLHSLSACGCTHCQREAELLGYDFPHLRDGILNLQRRLRQLDRHRLKRILAHQPNLWDFLALCAEGPTVLEWFRMRAGLLAARMREFRLALEQAAGRTQPFGSDIFPPSVALLGGHDYEAWSESTTYLTGGSSFGGVVGWATMVTNLASEWAPALCRLIPDLEEKDALELVYRIFGYDAFSLPQTVSGLHQDALPLSDIFAHEVAKLKAVAPNSLKLYPPISVSAVPDKVQALCTTVVDHDCDGAMLSFAANEETLGRILNLNLGKWLGN